MPFRIGITLRCEKGLRKNVCRRYIVVAVCWHWSSKYLKQSFSTVICVIILYMHTHAHITCSALFFCLFSSHFFTFMFMHCNLCSVYWNDTSGFFFQAALPICVPSPLGWDLLERQNRGATNAWREEENVAEAVSSLNTRVKTLQTHVVWNAAYIRPMLQARVVLFLCLIWVGKMDEAHRAVYFTSSCPPYDVSWADWKESKFHQICW